MSLLNEFIRLELNAYSKARILEAIENAKKDGAGNIELTFNIYSIVINSSENKVILSNDIIYEIPDEMILLQEFKEAISTLALKK